MFTLNVWVSVKFGFLQQFFVVLAVELHSWNTGIYRCQAEVLSHHRDLNLAQVDLISIIRREAILF